MVKAASGLERLMAIFARRAADGSYLYSDDDVRAVIPLLVFAGGEAGRDAMRHPALARVMTEFCDSAGLLGDFNAVALH